MKFLKSIPFIYTIMVLINPILNKFGIFYLHYALLILGCMVLIPRYLNRNGLSFKKRDGKFLAFFFYIIFMVAINIILPLSDVLLIANSLAFFLVFPLFWFFYLKQIDLDLLALAKALVFIALLNGIVCIMQFLISPTLFGLYNYSLYQIESVGYRPGALLNSPQVYGLFVIMASIIAFEIYATTKNNLFLLYGFALIPMSLLSGNKSVLFCIVFYLLLRITTLISLKNLFSGRALMILVLLIVNSFILINFSGQNQIIARNLDRIMLVFGDSESLRSSENRGRLKIYSEFVEPFIENPPKIISGNGIGSYSSKARNSEDLVERDTESYILMVFGEYGIITLLLFINILASSIYNAKKRQLKFNVFIINLILSSTFLFVHAFSHPIFFLFWPLILVPLIKGDSHLYLNNYNKK